MTHIVKITVDGAEHWTAEGSAVHRAFLARQSTGTETPAENDQSEEVDGEDRKRSEVHRDGDDLDTSGSDSGSSNRTGNDTGSARGSRRPRPAQPAAGS